MREEKSIAPLVHGITLGAAASVIVDASGEIHRNELGGHSSATLVAFTPEGRQLGEAAVMGMAANARGTATEVARLALIPYETLTSGLGALTSRHWQFAHTAGEEGVLVMSDVALSDGQTTSMSAVGLLGALLGKLRANSRAPAGTPVSIAIPPVGDAEGAVARAASLLHDAAHLGGWKLVAAPSAAQALGVALARKWPFGKEPWTSPAVRVLVLDMGASSTIAAVIKLTPPAAPDNKGSSSPRGAKAEVLAEASDAFLGASLYNEKLFDHFAAKVKETYV